MQEFFEKFVEAQGANWGLLYIDTKFMQIGDWSDWGEVEKRNIEFLLRENISPRRSLMICGDTQSHRLFNKFRKIQSLVCFACDDSHIGRFSGESGAVFLGTDVPQFFATDEKQWRGIAKEFWDEILAAYPKNSQGNPDSFDSHCASNYFKGGFEFSKTEHQGKNKKVYQYKIWGISECIQKHVFEKIERYKDSDRIFIEGETGVGKELVAKALHCKSKKYQKKKFIAVNCKEFGGDTNIQLAALFGCTKDWVPNIAERSGYFAEANGGTLFLDEVNSLGEEAQGLLLRALQERCYSVCGQKEYNPIDVDIQVICSTNQPLMKLVTRGDFRGDLYYRISSCKIEIPPLRLRGIEDFKLIVRNLLKQENEVYRQTKKSWQDIFIKDTTLEKMFKMSEWRGNIRQLQNVVKSTFYETRGQREMTEDILQKVIARDIPPTQENTWSFFPLPEGFKSIRDLEEEIYRQAYYWCKKDPKRKQKDVAEMLGVSEDTVTNRFKKYQA